MKQEREQVKDHYTVQELAELAGVTDGYIRRLLIDGNELRGEKFGTQWLIRRREAERYLLSRGLYID